LTGKPIFHYQFWSRNKDGTEDSSQVTSSWLFSYGGDDPKHISKGADNYLTIYILSTELRFCDRCMVKTRHEIVEDPETIYTYKRRRLYRCKECGHESLRRGLRPSAESVY
jgi:hypothetical protein